PEASAPVLATAVAPPVFDGDGSPLPPSPLEPSPLPTSATPATRALAATEPDTCYRRCLPLLLDYLHEEPGEKQLPDLARRLDLELKQFKKWLARACGESKGSEKKKGRRNVDGTASAAGESSRCAGGGHAA